ncbi:DUF4148 domain-containing protein [Aquabacterium sp. A7-Y]|uniref:DUF4148 domain-containing protein n=1 Tax=Aquabacterium sp. A7-Y TaxID=1349605 RepID=UPI00223CBDB0|nr:DUF4148 domain-containing protein [Aquabacterium sp. A7-Y]MCW7539975.1 DUF4148 domain-containing protein [Aquabacterium sp. A7-Y]
MNAKKNLIAVLMTAFAATGAFAGEANDFDQSWTGEAQSVKTRAEVKAELAQARAQGEQLAVFSGEATVLPAQAATATARSREDVKQETISFLRTQRSAAPINIGG